MAVQSDGTDLDPHNLKWQPRGEGGGGRGGAPAPVAVVEDGARAFRGLPSHCVLSFMPLPLAVEFVLWLI